jgi:hypothetical protein
MRDTIIKSVLSLNNTYSFADKNNIVWKVIDGKMIGKRSVWTLDWRSCWLEDTTKENVKTWWCGEDADYNEIFTK